MGKGDKMWRPSFVKIFVLWFYSRYKNDLFNGFFPPEFLESCRATSLLAELEDDDEELPDADEDDNDEVWYFAPKIVWTTERKKMFYYF